MSAFLNGYSRLITDIVASNDVHGSLPPGGHMVVTSTILTWFIGHNQYCLSTALLVHFTDAEAFRNVAVESTNMSYE